MLSTLIQFGPLTKKRYRGYWKSSKESNKIINITQKVTIERTFITIKFTYFEIIDNYVETW